MNLYLGSHDNMMTLLMATPTSGTNQLQSLLTSSSSALTGSSQGLVGQRDVKKLDGSDNLTNSTKQTSSTSVAVLLGLCLLLGEDSDAEVSVEVRLEGGRHDQILSGWQFEARANLPQVDEGL